jgi:hypothetical protein
MEPFPDEEHGLKKFTWQVTAERMTGPECVYNLDGFEGGSLEPDGGRLWILRVLGAF